MTTKSRLVRRAVAACWVGVALAAGPAAAADPAAAYEAGAAALRQGRPLDAIEILGPLAEERPGFRDVDLLLGQSYLMVGLHRPAKTHFEAASRARPQDGQATFLLGFALFQAARYVEAAEAFDRAVHLAPRNPLPLAYRALARLRLGDPVAARRDVDAALAIAPAELAALAALAELDLAEGRHAAAERTLRRLVEAQPENVDHRLLLARALLEAGRAADAAGILRPLAAASERSDVLYLHAQALLRGGDADAGRRALERFRARKAVEERLRLLEATVAEEPTDATSRLALVRLLLDERQLAAALVHLATLRQLLPGDPRVGELEREASRYR